MCMCTYSITVDLMWFVIDSPNYSAYNYIYCVDWSNNCINQWHAVLILVVLSFPRKTSMFQTVLLLPMLQTDVTTKLLMLSLMSVTLALKEQ